MKQIILAAGLGLAALSPATADPSQREAECERMVQDWEDGRRAAYLREYGDFAATIVDNCRWMLKKVYPVLSEEAEAGESSRR